MSINPDYLCPISQGIILDPSRARPCGHLFDGPFLEAAFARNTNCPLCRQPITAIEPDHALAEIIHRYIEQNPPLFNNRTLEDLIRERDTDPPPPCLLPQ